MILRKVLVLFLLSISQLFSQEFDFRFYSTEDGLPTIDVRDPSIDSKGFLWLNINGLYRFDGNKFTGNSQIASQIFGNLDKDSKLITFENKAYLLKKGFLNILNTSSGSLDRFSIEKLNNLNYKVNYESIDLDAKGNIYVTSFSNSGSKARLYKFNGKEFTFLYEFDDFNSNDRKWKFDYEIDEYGNIFYSNIDKRSVTYFNSKTKRKSNFAIEGKVFFSFLSRTKNKIFWVSNNRVYGLSSKGLTPLKVNNKLKDLQLSYLLRSVLVQDNGDIWLSGGERALLYYNNEKDILTDYKSTIQEKIPGTVDFLSLINDKGGNVWAGSYRGLLKISPKLNFFNSYFKEQYPLCNGDCSFRGFTEDKEGNVYAGYYNNIAKISPKSEATYAIFPQNKKSQFDIYYYKNLLLLEDANVFNLKSKTLANPFKSDQYSTDLGILCGNGEENVWYAREKEFFVLDEKNSVWKKLWVYSGADFKIEDLKFDKIRNVVWIATATNLFKYNIASNRVEEINPKLFGKNKLNIKSLELDKGEVMWLATDLGLIKYSLEKGSFKIFTEKDGLCNTFVVGILSEADSCLWLSTNKGLSRFSKKGESFINFFEVDGIAKNEFNRRSFYKAKDGKMFFGGIKGVTSFYPNEVMKKFLSSQRVKSLNLSSYSYFDAHRDSTIWNYFVSDISSFKIQNYFNNYSFTFSTSDFADTKVLRYTYMLEGFDNSWSDPQQNPTIIFNSLPAGSYKLRVKAMDVNNRPISNELSLDIKVFPPWYFSWWAITIYFLLGLLLSIYWINSFKKKLEKKQAIALKLKEAEQAKELENFKSRFFTNITHEFRTPLTVIIGMVDNLKSTIHEKDKSNLGLLESNSQKLLLFVNQLLDLSKLENASYEIAYIQSDIIQHVQDVLESFAFHLAKSSNKKFSFLRVEKSLLMDFDPDIIQKVLINLVGNAFKFTRQGDEISVKLSTNEHRLLIEVEDTGMGIDETEIPFVFDRFYQAGKNENIRPSRVGSGVGLAHSHELISLLNGTISVKSKKGEGTTFKIELPIKNISSLVNRELLNPLFNPSLEMRSSTLLEEDSSKKNLLIVEDDADLAQYLSSILNPIYNIQVARNGKEGVELALESIPDLIISDVMMPIKDGFELCDELKSNILTSHIPLTLLTAKSSSASRLEGLRYGANAYLSKPFVKEELLLIQQNLLKLRTENKERYQKDAFSTIAVENEVDQKFLKDLQKVVLENLADDTFGQKELCEKIGMSQSQLYRKLNGLLDTTPGSYIKTERLKIALNLLKTTTKNISEIAFEVGFSDAAYFTKSFKQEYQESPSVYRKRV